MARQVLQSGTVANDGTGDTLRGAAGVLVLIIQQLHSSASERQPEPAFKLQTSVP